MLFVEAVARQLMPKWDANTKLSIACIFTNNPVYLVFDPSSIYPELAVRVTASDEVRKVHEITQQLFAKVGDLVPEPIAVILLEGQNFAVQRGVKGAPWFQLARGISSQLQWDTLRDRAITALKKLHQGTAEIEPWITECSPGQALRSSLQECVAAGTKVSAQVTEQVEILSKRLDTLGTFRTFPQHGDYCLNNLIVDTESIHIIDFEDFGMTTMPLYDEISLALSMYTLAPKGINTSLRHELMTCVQESAATFDIAKEMLPGFFMYHLLIRLGEWSLGERRKQFRKSLMATLEHFTLNPSHFFDD